MANIKITMTSDEQWTMMQSLFGNVWTEVRRNTDKLQEYIDKATDIDLSQDTMDTLNKVRKLYSVLEDDLALVENIVTIRNIENKSERVFSQSYRATATLWEGITNHVEMIAWFIIENDIPVTDIHEKISHLGSTLQKEVCWMVKGRVDVLIDNLVHEPTSKKGEENAN